MTPLTKRGSIMSSAIRTTSWTLGDGRKVEVVISVAKSLVERIHNLDGDVVGTGIMDPVSQVEIVATVQGSEIARGALEEAAPNAQGVVAKVGKFGLRPDNAAAVRVLIAEAEAEATTPEYSARLAEIEAAEARADQDEAEYQAHARRVDAMMSLNGRAY